MHEVSGVAGVRLSFGVETPRRRLRREAGNDSVVDTRFGDLNGSSTGGTCPGAEGRRQAEGPARGRAASPLRRRERASHRSRFALARAGTATPWIAPFPSVIVPEAVLLARPAGGGFQEVSLE